MAVERQTLYEYLTSSRLWRALTAEFLGTAMVVFLSCGTMLLTSRFNQPPTDGLNIFVTAFTTGFTYAAADFVFEPTSGANFNPAFTFGLFWIGRTSLIRCITYTIAQLLGGLLGAAALFFVCPYDKRFRLGASILWNDVSPLYGFLIETMATFLAIFFILCSDEHKEKRALPSGYSAIRIGVTYMALTLSMYPYTSLSMNPARSLGPALLSWTWTDHWIYWAGPYIGALIACLFFGYCWARQQRHHVYRHTSGVVYHIEDDNLAPRGDNEFKNNRSGTLCENDDMLHGETEYL